MFWKIGNNIVFFILFVNSLKVYIHIDTHANLIKKTSRILSTLIARRSAIERVEVLPAPRELDPRLLMWKGGSVLSKLDTAKEMWIGQEEWNNMGARCLRDRALFV